MFITPPPSHQCWSAGFSVSKENLRVQGPSACFLPVSICCTNMRPNKGPLCKASASLVAVLHKANKTISKSKRANLPSSRSATKWGSHCCESSALQILLERNEMHGLDFFRSTGNSYSSNRTNNDDDNQATTATTHKKGETKQMNNTKQGRFGEGKPTINKRK